MEEKILALITAFLLLISFSLSACPGCPPLKFDPEPIRRGDKIYVVPGTKVIADPCEDYVHTCSNSVYSCTKRPHYLTITGSVNKGFFIIKVLEENITISKKEILEVIKANTYNDTTFSHLQPLRIKLEDVPSVDDIQGIPAYTVDCSKYTTTTTLNFTYVWDLEKKVHQAVENFAKRINNTLNVSTKIYKKGNVTINVTLLKNFIIEFYPVSTSYDLLILNITTLNLTSITNLTSGEVSLKKEVKRESKSFYVNYNLIFRKFYENGNVKARSFSTICGIEEDVYAKDVTQYVFEKGGTYYIYGSVGYEVIVK